MSNFATFDPWVLVITATLSCYTNLKPVIPVESPVPPCPLPVPVLYLSCATLRLSVRLALVCMLHHDTSTRLL